MICFPAPQCLMWGFLVSGAGRFVLESIDVGLRTNLGTSAREFIAFCKIATLPDLSVDALTALTALCERSTLKPFCLVRHSLVFITGLFPGGFDPSCLSFPKVCPATVVCCLWFRVLSTGFLYSPCSPRWSRRAVVQVECYVSLRPWLHVPWFLECDRVASGELLSLLSSERHVGLSDVRTMPSLSVSVIVASETTDFSVQSPNHVVPSVSMFWLCPRTLLKSARFLVGVARQPSPVAEHCFQPSVSSLGVRVEI